MEKKERLVSITGLPENIIFCKRCVMSNQRPKSNVEFKHSVRHKHTGLQIDKEGICDACRFAEQKEQIDWGKREKELLRLLDRHRKNDGRYDCIVPGSGGKDSVYASHLLKYKYGMHPLTVTWSPLLYTEYGYKNFCNWIDVGGFDNITFKPNAKIHKLLTKLSFENLLHPFHTFALGQKNLPPKIALKYKVPLVFYGESEAEYGNPIAETKTSLRDKSYYAMQNMSGILLSGVSIKELIEKYGLCLNDLMVYLPPNYTELEQGNIEVHYMGYYVKWTPQEAYYYAVEHTNFQARPFRTEGTYSKYNSIDDKCDDFHYYTTFIKFGIGRASYDASQEIRNKHLNREEGKSLVKRFDGEVPSRYSKEVLDYIGITPEHFMELCDKFRSPHLWTKVNGKWRLRHTVNNDGVDD
ncbi:MAG: N-acetyl sugar amidotransferase [Candidatus Omnitrophica bacterium]|nr:N-acetyl sugar amidotransferase [Candidatus Omnitrophota bacterium]